MRLKKIFKEDLVYSGDVHLGSVDHFSKYVILIRLPSLRMARYLNRKGYRIIFRIDLNLPEEDLVYLLRLGKFYSQEDITTAVIAGHKHIGNRVNAQYLSYNQVVKREVVHAEKVLTDAKVLRIINSASYWYMDLEPCASCLKAMVYAGAEDIRYRTKHKDKWNTEEYFNVVKENAEKGISYTYVNTI